MTIQELINVLDGTEDRSLPVHFLVDDYSHDYLDMDVEYICVENGRCNLTGI